MLERVLVRITIRTPYVNIFETTVIKGINFKIVLYRNSNKF